MGRNLGKIAVAKFTEAGRGNSALIRKIATTGTVGVRTDQMLLFVGNTLDFAQERGIIGSVPLMNVGGHGVGFSLNGEASPFFISWPVRRLAFFPPFFVPRI